jgi:8-oxo-dGTP pyrophosphatase MutT (NUDIX family)
MNKMDASQYGMQKMLPAKEFLLAEHKYFGDLFWKNEEMGERRVTILTTLITAIIAAIAALLKQASGPDYLSVLAIAVFAAAGVSVLGVMTLLRMMRRNRTSDEYKGCLDEVRRMFRMHFDGEKALADYHPFGISRNEKPFERTMGGLTHFVAALNSIVFSGLACLIVMAMDELFGIRPALANLFSYGVFFIIVSVLVVLVFSLSFFLQYLWIKKSRPTHAGGVVYQIKNGRPCFLVVTAKRKAEEWVLPKGHIGEKEKPEAAAVREVGEEAGVQAEIRKRIKTASFRTEKEKVEAEFYLMEYKQEIPDRRQDNRKIKWCFLEEGISSLSHKESWDVLCKAYLLLREK